MLSRTTLSTILTVSPACLPPKLSSEANALKMVTFLAPTWVIAYAFHKILSFYSFPSSFESTEIQTGKPFHLHDIIDSLILLDIPSSRVVYQVTSHPNTSTNP